MKSVESAMIKPVTVKADDSLNDAVNIMRTRRVDTIFVVNNQNKLLGFLDIEDINQGLRARKELIDHAKGCLQSTYQFKVTRLSAYYSKT